MLFRSRLILEANFQRSLTKTEMRFILGLKDTEPLPVDVAPSKLESFVLPTYLTFSLTFNKYSDGIFIPFGTKGLAPKESRHFNVSFVKDLETWDEPYYYSGFKNWSTIRPKGGAVKVRQNHGSYAFKNFVGLDMPIDLKDLLHRMNTGKGYQDLRLKLASRRRDFLNLSSRNDAELEENRTEFLDLDDLTRTGVE
mgnify:FL=1